MTPLVESTAQKADRSNQNQGPEEVFDDFVTFVSCISYEKSYQDFKAMSLDYLRLKEELKETNTALSRNIKEFNNLNLEWNAEKQRLDKVTQEQSKMYKEVLEEKEVAYGKLEEEQRNGEKLNDKNKSLEEAVQRSIATSKKCEAEAASLGTTIRERDDQLQRVEKEKKELEDELQSTQDRLDTQSKELATAKSELTMVQSFIEKLTPLEHERASISEMLGSSFNNASGLFRLFLGRDLEVARLKDSKTWDRVRDHVSIQRSIPLPASNSAHAKQMRTIAGLVICARALTQYVFKPTYLSAVDGIEKALDALPAASPDQDSFVRAVLLKVLPDQQRTCREACAERVVEEVFATLVGLVPADQHATFKSRLSQLTASVCDNWQRVQRLGERVEPCFAFDMPEDWQPLPTSTDPIVSDDDAASARPQSQGSRGPQPKQQDLETSALSAGDIVKVVWPAFLATSLEQPTEEEVDSSELIHHGYVLTHADVRNAANEEMSRRTMRRATRESDASGQRKRRDSAVVLSNGASDGSDAK